MDFVAQSYFYGVENLLRCVRIMYARPELNDHTANPHETWLILLVLMSLTIVWGQLVLVLCWGGVLGSARFLLFPVRKLRHTYADVLGTSSVQ